MRNQIYGILFIFAQASGSIRFFFIISAKLCDQNRNWWAREDSNLQPDRYERPALTS